MTNHKDLIVYQKAKELTIEIIKDFTNQKLDFIQRILVDQLIRAVSSIGANIAEGYGRHYQKNYYQFLSIDRGSAFEVNYWLEIILEINPNEEKIINDFMVKNEELIKMLTSLMKIMEKGDKRVQT